MAYSLRLYAITSHYKANYGKGSEQLNEKFTSEISDLAAL
jgi:hypothetical protein